VLRTRFTDLVGCTIPIQQAGMGSLANPRLAKAVADAGGLGIVSIYTAPVDMAAGILDDLAERTPGVVGGNIIVRYVEPERLHELIATTARRVRVVDFFFSDPDPELVDLVHSQDALASWQVGSREEAIAAAEAGCDFIIAQGIGAGGHVRGTIGLLALLDEVLDAVDVPVLAAGGIGSGRTMAAALAAGADGVRIGTRLVASEEAGAHPAYLQALIAARPHDTIYNDDFQIDWPDPPAPGRLLRSSVEAARTFDGDVVGEATHFYVGGSYPVMRWGVDAVRAGHTGAIEAMSLWAGESVSGVRRVQPAGEIIREMAEEAETLLRRWC
jgi:NAD(P)H-dependent flavin oxidoreductase YrpB (nitropropane dioxygenase family)